MTVFTCRDNWEDMMTCIYEAWASRLGHRNIRLEIEPIEQPEMFCEYLHIDGDAQKADKVVSSVCRKISGEAYRWIFCAAHGLDKSRVDDIYRFLICGFHYGSQVTAMLTLQPVMRLLELSRRVKNEAHFYREFARFTSHENRVYVCHFEPENDVLLMVAEHFADRMPSEHWLMIDDRRKTAAVHPADEDMYLTVLTDEEWDLLKETEYQQDLYTVLWKEFFHTIAIRERENTKCQRNMIPLKYRKHVTEFMK